MSSEEPVTRRYRLISDLSLFELVPLLGAGATAAQLRQFAEAMASGFALERLVDGAWKVVGVTSGAEPARAWLNEKDSLT